jgi:hypothetical protein
VRLLKSWKNDQGRKYPIGWILGISKGVALRMIDGGIAEEYKGEYPPRTKMQTDFFKKK